MKQAASRTSPTLYINAFTLIAIIACLIFAGTAHAEQYRLRFVDQSLAPVSGVWLYGNHRINDLARRASGSNGEIMIDVTALRSPNPYVTFTHAARKLAFSPAGIILSPRSCPRNVCTIQTSVAENSEQVVVEWRAVNNQGRGIPNVLLRGLNTLVSCPLRSDSDGYTVFPATRRPSGCNRNDSDSTNNPIAVVADLGPGVNCAYTNRQTNLFEVCPQSGNATGFTTISCSATATPTLGTNTTYRFRVLNVLNGRGVQNVEISGVPLIDLANRRTDSTGALTVTTRDLNVPANAQFRVFPVGRFAFYPQSFDVSNGSCPNNTCTFWAMNDGTSEQSSITVRAENHEGRGLAGVTVESPNLFQCGERSVSTTDEAGRAAFPFVPRNPCNGSTFETAPVVINPSLSGCRFSHISTTPFQFPLCTAAPVSTSFIASCGGNDPVQHVISGSIVGADGRPVIGAKIFSGQNEAGVSDSSGNFSVLAPAGSTPDLKVNYLPNLYRFDPEQVEFLNIDRNHNAIEFRVANTDNSNAVPTPTPACPEKTSYQISGRVIDKFGAPLSGIEIRNRDQAMTKSAIDGSYSFEVPAREDLWLTADSEDLFFDPAGYGKPNNACDQPEVNFAVIGVPSHTLSGRVFGANAVPLANVQVNAEYGQQNIITQSNDDGGWVVTVPDDVPYRVVAVSNSSAFVPGEYQGIATENRLDLDFRSAAPQPSQSATPLPTNAPAPQPSTSPTATPSQTPQPSQQPSMTPAPSFSPTPSTTPVQTAPPTQQPSPTATRSLTPTPIATASSTPFPTPTATASSTPTSSPSATPQPTVSQPPAPAPSATSTPTATPGPVQICHYPQNNPSARTTLTVPAQDLATHLAHGDTEGPCGCGGRTFPSCVTAGVNVEYCEQGMVLGLDGRAKQTLCHYPPGNPANFHTISVSESAVAAHLQHGDTIGACACPDPIPTPVNPPAPSPSATPTPIASQPPQQTPSATPSAQPSATPSPSPTPPAESGWLDLATACRYDSMQLRWRVRSYFNQEITVGWRVYESGAIGGFKLASQSEMIFTTELFPFTPTNTLVVFVNGVQHGVRTGDLTMCSSSSPQPTPTASLTPPSTPEPMPSYTPAPTATVTPAPSAPADPTPLPTRPPAEEPAPPATPIPSVQPTAAPQPPEPMYVIEGELRAPTGRRIAGTFLSRVNAIPAGAFTVYVSDLTRPGLNYSMSLSGPSFEYRFSLPAGRYRVSFESSSDTVVQASAPRRYNITLPAPKRSKFDIDALNFAIRLRNNALSSASSNAGSR